ncbi:MAG: PAS domain S-box protein [Nitrospirota bacterium]
MDPPLRQAETFGNAEPAPMDPASGPSGLGSQALRAEQIRLLYLNAPFGLIAIVVNSLILTVIQWPVVTTTALLGWLAYTLALASGRFLLVRRFRRRQPAPSAMSRWGRLFVAGAALSGLGWGSTALFLFPEHSIAHQVFLSFVLAGMTAGAVTTLSPVREAFLSFAIPTLVPLALRFLAQGDPLGYAMGGMVALFTVIMAFVARKMHDTLATSLTLRFANEGLIADLTRQVEERRRAQEALRHAHDELEDRVRQRTEELAGAVERLQSENVERARVEAALRESEARFRSIIESTPDGVIVSDQQGTILLCNGSVESIFGYGRGELTGLPLTCLMPERFREPHLRGLERLVSTGESSLIGKTVVMTGLRKDGGEFPLELELSSWQAGTRRYVSAIIRDITERQRVEHQLWQAQKMEAIGRLAGGVAHDFNNLLTVIVGQCALLLRRIGPEDPARRKIEVIANAGERATSLTRQLLAFSRQQVLEPKVLDLNAMIAKVAPLLQHLIGEDIQLTTSLEPNLGCIRADPGQTEQVILNLAANARDAMPGGGRLTIETRSVHLDKAVEPASPPIQPGTYVTLAVKDTGFGMDADTLARIFDPFFTTKAPGKGTGLGLATVYGIVEQSGGAILASSEPGQGSTFRIYWPRAEGTGEAADSPAPHSDAVIGSPTILLVEDEPMVRELAADILREIGYTVLEAGNGHAALQVCQRHSGQIHLLLTDVVMPGMSGKELADRLLAVRPGLRVLYMSGYADHPSLHHDFWQNDMDFLPKPFTEKTLTRKVREALKQ